MARATGLELGILGSTAAWRDGVHLPLGGAKQRAVVALLALERGRTVSTDTLIEALWPQRPPGRPATAIQGYVSHLRKALGFATIVTDPSGYRLDLGEDQVDAERFERHVTAASALPPAARASALDAALTLWRGTALADFAYETWAQPAIARLEDRRLAVIEERIEAELEDSRHAELVGVIEALVREHPHRERLRRQLMLALYRSGRQAEALDAYTTARQVLIEELGIEPGPELQALHRSVLNQDDALAPVQRIARATPTLPVPATPLLGRDDEFARIRELLADAQTRLVTLTGPGGMGKTRLALEIARATEDRFPDVFFVELASLRDPELVLTEIRSALGIDGDPAAWLAERNALLVLDNLEQVLEAAPAIAELLAACPRLFVVATSRERLHLAQEVELPLRPLEPEAAAGLFADRAARLGVAVDSHMNDVTDLCARLDNLPLAIELAAGRSKLFEPGELLTLLADRTDLLVGAAQDAEDRHRALSETIAWSHNLLRGAERDLFEALAVFAGRFDVADVEAVFPGRLDSLGALVDKSLVTRRDERHGRLAMLATIREFALERLDGREDSNEIRRRHAEHVLGEVARADELLDGPEQADAFQQISRRMDDLRAALDWAGGFGELDLELKLAAAAGWFWFVRGHLAEGRTRLEDALTRARRPDSAVLATAHMRAGSIADSQVDLPEAEAHYRSALRIRTELGDRSGASGALNNLGNLALQSGDYAAASVPHQESLAIARELGETGRIAAALHNLALDYLGLEDADSAVPLLEESLEHANAVGNDYGAAHCHTNLGFALVEVGRFDDGAAHMAECVVLLRALGASDGLASTIENLAALDIATGDPEMAARALGVAAAARESVGSGFGRSEADRAHRTEARARDALGDGRFQRIWDEGRGLSLDDAFAFAEQRLAHI